MFETIIRVLGGMLTAHELSGDAGFLTKCGPLTPSVYLALPSAQVMIKHALVTCREPLLSA